MKLQGLVSEELNKDPDFALLSSKMQCAQQLSVYHRIRAESWKNESDEVRAEIQNIFNENHQVKGDEENPDESEPETKDDDNDGDFNDDDDDEKIFLGHRQKYVLLYYFYLRNCLLFS